MLQDITALRTIQQRQQLTAGSSGAFAGLSYSRWMRNLRWEAVARAVCARLGRRIVSLSGQPGAALRTDTPPSFDHEHRVDPSAVDRLQPGHAPKVVVDRSGVIDCGDRKRRHRYSARGRGSPPYAASHHRKLDRAPTGRYLHQRRRREHHHPDPLARVEELLRLRRRDEQHPRMCPRLREWLRDAGAYRDHSVSPQVRALDEAPRDSARSKPDRALRPPALAHRRAIGATSSPTRTPLPRPQQTGTCSAVGPVPPEHGTVTPPLDRGTRPTKHRSREIGASASSP